MIADLTATPTFRTVSDALTILENLEHRGATGADVASGDGAGIMLAMPDTFIRSVFANVPDAGHYGVGMWMVPKGREEWAQGVIAQHCDRVGLTTLGWRVVPVDSTLLGPTSAASEPTFVQQLVAPSPDNANVQLALYSARKLAEREDGIYASSFSTSQLIYKGMLSSPQLRLYFDDLRNEELRSAIAVVHSRFSTNVMPRWDLAQPFRYIAHNGEINTIRGNRHWMTARESTLSLPNAPVPFSELTPVITPNMSDSASFDEAIDLLVQGGRSLPHAVLMLIPEAWEKITTMSDKRRDFYRYHAALMEPWDGPASVTFCDGTVVGAVLDRNGLRPARYWVTKDRRVIFSSEVGVLDIDPALIERKGRLQPGKVFLVDLSLGRIVDDDELKDALADAAPYGEWLAEQQHSLDDLPTVDLPIPTHERVVQRQLAFGYSDEDIRLILTPMATSGEEPIGSMGSDAALPVLSTQARPLFDYFTQLFAQVTNPPLDAIREELVTSSRVAIGGEDNLLSESARHCNQILLSSPVLTPQDLGKIRHIESAGVDWRYRSSVVPLHFAATGSESAGERLRHAVNAVCDQVVDLIREGSTFVILSDRQISPELAPIPSLLAASAVHHRLVREHLRTSAAIIVEAGDVREVHHVALLLGMGVSAVCPYLGYDTIEDLVRNGQINWISRDGACYNYAKSLTKGVIKVMSKMGVSTVASYVGSQLFEAVGVSDDILSAYFPDYRSRMGGLTLDTLATNVLRNHAEAYPTTATHAVTLRNRGEYQWRRDGEIHLFNPRTVQKLQHATRERRYDIFKEYTTLVNEQAAAAATLRSRLALKTVASPLPLDEVEPVSTIVKRFSSGAMSYGSISAEAHETLAIAMNRLGGKSNTGEGGEDDDRLEVVDPQFNRRSAIKQVASGRFGVTSRYLVNADDLQIKMAQGAKPGEGGQLPGSKVYPWIAKTRHSTPGVGLISPPPHHDIYSIEDLAQLIYDLKNANNEARIHVKLVSEQGVGTIAAGVAKAHADVILISGHDGGTGAAPLTSLKHAGTPWELGLAEANQTLAMNGLRSRVVLQADGQLKTGRDVVIAALLGAEEFGFATAPLVVSGCVMMRVCHLDTCPVGIATQNPELRKRFTGQPEFVQNFFEFIAEEVRELMAALGVRTLDELIGDTSKLEAISLNDGPNDIDLSSLLAPIAPDQRHQTMTQDHGLDAALDWSFIDAVRDAVSAGESVVIESPITNVQRTVGTLSGSMITRLLGSSTLPANTVTLRFNGSAGQSLGAFVPAGVTIRLEGDANDYVGKGLSGGRIVVRPAATATFASHENIIAGNVIGYGATSGELFLSGVVGERLGVRNSGATIVVEGSGDHACEYMTGGTVVILGKIGRNLAAGMSGGTVYLFDPNDEVQRRLSKGTYEVDPLDEHDEAVVLDIVTRFADETGSKVAQSIVDDWANRKQQFVRIETAEYQRARDGVHHG